MVPQGVDPDPVEALKWATLAANPPVLEWRPAALPFAFTYRADVFLIEGLAVDAGRDQLLVVDGYNDRLLSTLPPDNPKAGGKESMTTVKPRAWNQAGGPDRRVIRG